MPTIDQAPITFVVPGQRMDSATRGARSAWPIPLGLDGTLKASVRLGMSRASGEAQRLIATPGRDIVVLHLANGPALILHPTTARDLLLAQAITTRGANAVPAHPPPPSTCQHNCAGRDWKARRSPRARPAVVGWAMYCWPGSTSSPAKCRTRQKI